MQLTCNWEYCKKDFSNSKRRKRSFWRSASTLLSSRFSTPCCKMAWSWDFSCRKSSICLDNSAKRALFSSVKALSSDSSCLWIFFYYCSRNWSIFRDYLLTSFCAWNASITSVLSWFWFSPLRLFVLVPPNAFNDWFCSCSTALSCIHSSRRRRNSSCSALCWAIKCKTIPI